jgi:hypothetical protein
VFCENWCSKAIPSYTVQSQEDADKINKVNLHLFSKSHKRRTNTRPVKKGDTLRLYCTDDVGKIEHGIPDPYGNGSDSYRILFCGRADDMVKIKVALKHFNSSSSFCGYPVYELKGRNVNYLIDLTTLSMDVF